MTRTMKSLERKWIVAYKVHEQGKMYNCCIPEIAARMHSAHFERLNSFVLTLTLMLTGIPVQLLLT